MKYVRGLHNDLKRILMLFNPIKIDQVSVQEKYLEEDGNHRQQNDSSKKDH